MKSVEESLLYVHFCTVKLLARSLYVECVISSSACYLILHGVLDQFVDSEIEKVSFSIVKIGTSEELMRCSTILRVYNVL